MWTVSATVALWSSSGTMLSLVFGGTIQSFTSIDTEGTKKFILVQTRRTCALALQDCLAKLLYFILVLVFTMTANLWRWLIKFRYQYPYNIPSKFINHALLKRNVYMFRAFDAKLWCSGFTSINIFHSAIDFLTRKILKFLSRLIIFPPDGLCAAVEQCWGR